MNIISSHALNIYGKEKMILPEVKIRKILYATDLSDSARYALAYAISMANTYNAELIILHVLPEDPNMDSSIVGHIGTDKWKEIKKRNEQDARAALIGKKREIPIIQEVLDQFCKNVKDNIGEHHVVMDETIVEHGNPVEKIISVSQEKDCDLIVMGSYGIGGLAGVIMGSTSRRVLSLSKKPVLLVHLPEEE